MKHTDVVVEEPYRHAYVTDEQYPRRVSRALFGRQLRGWRFWVPLGVIVVVLLVVLVGMLSEGDGTGSAIAFGPLAVVVAVLLLSYVLTVRRNAALIPPGSVLCAGMTDDAFHTSGPAGSSAIAYWTLRDVEVRGEFLFVQWRATKAWTAYPAALVPGAELDLLRARIAGATAPTAGAAAGA